MPPLVERIAVAVRADDRAGMDDDAVADAGLRVNDDVGKQAHVIADLAVPAEVVAAQQHGASAQFGPRANHAVRPDVRRGINLGRGGDARARMNAGGRLVRRKEEREHPGDGDARIRHTNEDLL